jgi:SAM-dependent methyltransferase
MKETAKCYEMRSQRGDFDKYLNGNGIDVGAGPAPLSVPNGSVRAWDRSDGDGQLLESVPDGSLDFVYSSHCLEHLEDVAISLTNWVRVTKPGGYLYVVVPDYTLFEHHLWPSKFNPNHTQSFSLHLSRSKVGRANHYHIENDVRPILEHLGCTWISAGLEDNDYNYNLGWIDQTLDAALAQICFIAQRSF